MSSTQWMKSAPPSEAEGVEYISRGASVALADHPLARREPPATITATATLVSDRSQGQHQQLKPQVQQRRRKAIESEADPIAVVNPRPTPWPVTATCSHIDYSTTPRLGFPVGARPGRDAAELHARPSQDADEAARERRWHANCCGVPLLASASPSTIAKLRRLARRPRQGGIPRTLRPVMWLTLTGMAAKLDENEYMCASLLRRHGYVTGVHAAAIAADLERTFPGHPYFADGDVGLYKLRNLLHALCWRCTLLNYCQSFNYLAGFLLLVLDDEERAFWMLTHILETLLPNDYFNETLLGARVDQAVFEVLVQRRLPRLARAVAAMRHFEIGAVLPPWAMSLYVNTLPVETTLRVWDYMFTESEDPSQRTTAHLGIALAVLRHCEGALLACEDAGDAMLVLREATETLTDADTLIATARSMGVSAEELHALRQQMKPAVAEDMRLRAEARMVMQERRVTDEERRHRPPPATAAGGAGAGRGGGDSGIEGADTTVAPASLLLPSLGVMTIPAMLDERVIEEEMRVMRSDTQ